MRAQNVATVLVGFIMVSIQQGWKWKKSNSPSRVQRASELSSLHCESKNPEKLKTSVWLAQVSKTTEWSSDEITFLFLFAATLLYHTPKLMWTWRAWCSNSALKFFFFLSVVCVTFRGDIGAPVILNWLWTSGWGLCWSFRYYFFSGFFWQSPSQVVSKDVFAD